MLIGNLLAVDVVQVAIQDCGSLDDLASTAAIVGGRVELAFVVDAADLVAGVGFYDDAAFILCDGEGIWEVAGAGAIGAASVSPGDIGNIRTIGAAAGRQQ